MKRLGSIAALLLACSRHEATLAVPDATDLADARARYGEILVDATTMAPAPSLVLHEAASAPRLGAPAWLGARPISGKSIGHTSVVYRLELEGGTRVAWKPNSRRGRNRFRGEIAAYRLATLLDLPNVTPAYPVRVSFAATLAVLVGDSHELLAREAVTESNGEVRGVMIPWLKELEFLPLESGSFRARWARWLADGGPIEETDRALAAQVSAMLIFDALTANWDRFSGANVGYVRSENRVLFVDNDGAFFETPGRDASALAPLRRVDRYSRALVGRLRQIDRPALEAAIGELEPSEPLLKAAAIEGIERRRKLVLGVVDDRISKFGEGRVLYFP